MYGPRYVKSCKKYICSYCRKEIKKGCDCIRLDKSSFDENGDRKLVYSIYHEDCFDFIK